MSSTRSHDDEGENNTTKKNALSLCLYCKISGELRSLQCEGCKNWTHYLCSELPNYQILIFETPSVGRVVLHLPEIRYAKTMTDSMGVLWVHRVSAYAGTQPKYIMYRIPSLTTILFGGFLVYVTYSLWSMFQLFIPPNCSNAKQCLQPLIEENPKFQLLAYYSTKRNPKRSTEVTLFHKEESLDYNNDWEKVIDLQLPSNVRSNGSLFLHFFLTTGKLKSTEWAWVVKEPLSVYANAPLTQYHIPEAKSFNLMGNDEENKSPETGSTKNQKKFNSYSSLPVTHLRSQIVFNILTHVVNLPLDKLPYEIGRNLRVTPKGKYLPILHIDTMSMRIKDLLEITPDMKSANLTFKYSPISFGKLRMWIQFDDAMESMTRLGFTRKDIDEVKGIFSDSNLYLLCITFLVASLHLVFDILAFKNDVAFWNGLQSMEGISPSTVLWRAFAQIVIFLYLMEENTSLLVLAPAAVACVIELWKVTKAFHVKLDGWKPILQRSLTTAEDNTHQLDTEGFRYLSYIIYPLTIGGAIYSLVYVPHKSWYSWVISSLVNGIYAFGFLFMLPQLFINYKLKSVAHLPWRAFMYKAFNTFIDDLFAFIITMPMAHRVACFRDDLVFIIYLYQRWLYPVDKSRINEFGQYGEDENKKKK